LSNGSSAWLATAQAAALQAQIYHHALAAGSARGHLVSAGVLVLSLVIALFMMRVSRADLSGAGPAPGSAGNASAPGPETPAGQTLSVPAVSQNA